MLELVDLGLVDSLCSLYVDALLFQLVAPRADGPQFVTFGLGVTALAASFRCPLFLCVDLGLSLHIRPVHESNGSLFGPKDNAFASR